MPEDQAKTLRRYPTQYVWHWMMKDGTNVTIRPIRAEDEPLMVKFHEGLSDRSVYLRYFCSLSLKSRVSHERLARICFADYEREIPLIAERREPVTGRAEIIGVGRLTRLLLQNQGEVAVVVSDQYQKKGLGTELLSRCIQVAREEKIAVLLGEMLSDNLGMQVILRRLGFRAQMQKGFASVRARLELF